jgi:23S rRNA-/tRNA-specific pseudouridylate synthase
MTDAPGVMPEARGKVVPEARGKDLPEARSKDLREARGKDLPEARGDKGERIAKWLARAGVASRRDAEKLLVEGQVMLNNTRVTHPATFVSPGDIVVVNGAVVDAPERTRLWRYQKPVGVVTTNSDPQRRPSIELIFGRT